MNATFTQCKQSSCYHAGCLIQSDEGIFLRTMCDMPNPPVADAGRWWFREMFAKEVRAEMARKRISGRELARRLDKGQQWVLQRINGVKPIELATFPGWPRRWKCRLGN